jgi:hypothetical protein
MLRERTAPPAPAATFDDEAFRGAAPRRATTTVATRASPMVRKPSSPGQCDRLRIDQARRARHRAARRAN